MTVTEINPTVSSFSPVVTDVEGVISIVNVNPNVENPDVLVSLIYSN
jgi:hypothetical protein